MRLIKNNQLKSFLKKVIPLLFLLSPCLMAAGEEGPSAAVPAEDSVYVFRFVAGNDMFYIPLQGNDVRLVALCRVLEAHRAAIEAGMLPVQVDSYCASMPTADENFATAFVRANRVKSEMITRKGLTEEHFVTANHARAYLNYKDAVVVTLRIPADSAVTPSDTAVVPSDTAVILSETKDPPQQGTPSSDTAVILSNAKELRPQSAGQENLQSVQHDDGTAGAPYCFALRTNLLYDAMLLPTLGVEWRINRDFSIKLDGSLSRWGGHRGELQKIWMLSPEVRRYLLRDRRFYVGVAANYGQYNLYGYPLGNLMKDDTGYQGHLWSAGFSVGYHLPVWRCLSADFNLGLGYTRSSYDSFTSPYGVRVIKQRDRKKNLWGPTQAGISLVWKVKGKK